MLTKQLMNLWFAHVSQHMGGFLRGAIYEVNQDSRQIEEALVSSSDFELDERIRSAADSVAKRYKAIVQKVQYAESVQGRQASADGAVVSNIEYNYFLVCCPIIFDRKLGAVLCIEIRRQRNGQSNDLLGEVESSIQWLYSLAGADIVSTFMAAGHRDQHAKLAVELSALAISHADANTAATAVTSRLASYLECERVTLGFTRDSSMQIYAVSNSASYEVKQSLLKRIETAMQEAVDQQESLAYPSLSDSYQALQAHQELSAHQGNSRVCTVPAVSNDEVFGCICLERSAAAEPFSAEIVALCEQLTTLIAPMIEYRRRNELKFIERLKLALQENLAQLAQLNKMARLLAILAVSLLLLPLALIEWTYRIPADAALEGAIERVVTAPEAGFINQASVRPGDLIEQGDVLATLDDRDLQLEKLKWSGKQQQVAREFREALATSERSRIGILRAQRDQADAQLAILEKKLERTRITSPISGVIVSGDYTRSLGSPIDKGQIMYRLSPLDDYRIVMQVDEADIAQVVVGMEGKLVLNAAVADSYDFVVDKVTPVSQAENGSNTFQVEGLLQTRQDYLRPGMQGVARIEAGERSLLWIWTHRMVDWIRLKLWELS